MTNSKYRERLRMIGRIVDILSQPYVLIVGTSIGWLITVLQVSKARQGAGAMTERTEESAHLRKTATNKTEDKLSSFYNDASSAVGIMPKQHEVRKGTVGCSGYADSRPS